MENTFSFQGEQVLKFWECLKEIEDANPSFKTIFIEGVPMRNGGERIVDIFRNRKVSLVIESKHHYNQSIEAKAKLHYIQNTPSATQDFNLLLSTLKEISIQ